MKSIKLFAASAAFAFAGATMPAFADATLHVFLWDNGPDMEMSENHKIGDGADRLTDSMGTTTNATVVPAGNITFDVLNASQDQEHEMVISPLAGPDAPLPYDADAMEVDEEAAGSKGEVEGLAPGERGKLTVALEPGTYALYCNITGHYAAGMWQIITVK